jgi:hypothetical protein
MITVRLANIGLGTGDTNTSRARHAEDIKDSADVLLILANTDRIATNNPVHKTMQNYILNRGSYNRVKLVATQIDVSLSLILPNIKLKLNPVEYCGLRLKI